MNLTLANRIDAATLSERRIVIAICGGDAVSANHAVPNGPSVAIDATAVWLITYRLIVGDHAVVYRPSGTINASAKLSLPSGNRKT